MKGTDNYIKFDWTMKSLLRNKANFGVLEGLLTPLLDRKITIQKLLESESNQEDEYDKQNIFSFSYVPTCIRCCFFNKNVLRFTLFGLNV